MPRRLMLEPPSAEKTTYEVVDYGERDRIPAWGPSQAQLGCITLSWTGWKADPHTIVLCGQWYTCINGTWYVSCHPGIDWKGNNPTAVFGTVYKNETEIVTQGTSELAIEIRKKTMHRLISFLEREGQLGSRKEEREKENVYFSQLTLDRLREEFVEVNSGAGVFLPGERVFVNPATGSVYGVDRAETPPVQPFITDTYQYPYPPFVLPNPPFVLPTPQRAAEMEQRQRAAQSRREIEANFVSRMDDLRNMRDRGQISIDACNRMMGEARLNMEDAMRRSQEESQLRIPSLMDDPPF